MKLRRFLISILFVCLIVSTIIPARADSYASDICSIMSTYSYQNIMASSAVQQSVNGLYRSMELLEKITLYLDGDSII